MDELEQRLNAELMKKKKILNIGKIVAAISFLTFIVAFATYLQLKNQLLLFVTFGIFVASVMFIVTYKSKLMKYIKKAILENVIPKMFGDKKIIYVPNGIAKKEFEVSKMYNGYNQYYSSDGIKSLNDEFYISNVTAIEKEENSKKTIFNGIFGYMKTEEFYSDEIVIKPDVENKYISNVINSTNKMMGTNGNTVRLENNEFEKYFEVYSKDQIRARQIVTVDYMEKILNMKSELNTLIKIIYRGNKKYVAIWNKRIIDEKAVYKNGVRLNEIIERFESIMKILKEC